MSEVPNLGSGVALALRAVVLRWVRRTLRLLLRGFQPGLRKVDVRLPGKGNSNPHGARPVHLIITMIEWIRTSRLSMKNSLFSLV